MSVVGDHIPGPVLTTERLTLRPPAARDLDAFAAFYGSDAAAPVGGPVDAKGAYRLFTSLAGQWPLLGFSWFMAEQRDTGATIGTVGPHFPPDHADLELGWIVYPCAQGKGYGFEAASAALRWTRETLNPDRLVSYIDPDNAPSGALARKLGAATEGTRAAHDAGCEVWVHPAGRA